MIKKFDKLLCALRESDSTLTSDQEAAISGAASPSGSNVFATMADIPEIPEPQLTRDLTYSQLMAEITAGTLHKGESITITDYRTVHTIQETTATNTGDLEPLLITAISNNELKPEAYSLSFPDDIIYYCPDNNQEIVPGCTNGYIYRRIDTKQANDFPFDFRQVKFRRWQISQPTWNASANYYRGFIVKSPANTTLWVSLIDDNIGNAVGSDNSFWRQFEWDNNSYPSWSPFYFPIDDGAFLVPNANYIDYKMWANTSDYNSAISNKIEAPQGNLIELSNIVIFGANFQNNSIRANFQCNSIGDYFRSNSVGANFQYNNIGAYFQFNNVGEYFKHNIIEAFFAYNSVGKFFSYNSIGDNFQYNSIGTYFQFNNIRYGFQQNKITANFKYNWAIDIVGVDFITATHVYAAYNCTLFIAANNTRRLKYCNSSDVELVVAVDA